MNPKVGKTLVERSNSFASLTKKGSQEVYHFLINPEETQENHGASYASLPVMGTAQPLTRYQSSGSTYTFADVKLWVSGNRTSMRNQIDTLVKWTKPGADGADPPKLSFVWGSWKLDPVVLGSVDVRVTARVSGEPTEATLTLNLLLSPDPPKPKENPDGQKLTERERTEEAKKVEEKLTKDKKLADKLGWKKGQKVSVDDKGNVSLIDPKTNKPKPSGNLRDILGKDLKPGLDWVGKPSTPKK